MPSSYSRVVLHTMFSTKYRNRSITPEIEDSLLRYLVGRLKLNGSHTIEINAVEDHVHIIHTLPRNISIADLIREIKKWSSSDIKKEFPDYEWFYWQTGFSTFSVDYRKMDQLIDYVRNQKVHHSSNNPENTFEKELVWLLTHYGIEFNIDYLFPEPVEIDGL